MAEQRTLSEARPDGHTPPPSAHEGEPPRDRPDAPEARRPWFRRPWVLALSALLLAVAGVLGVRYWAYSAAQESTEDAFIEARVIRIRPRVAGHIAQVRVDDNQEVNEGQLLVQIGKMRAGQPVEIRVDAFPGRVFRGHIHSIQRGTGSRFSLLPPENASGNFVKVVQRVPVKIVFDDPPDPSV